MVDFVRKHSAGVRLDFMAMGPESLRLRYRASAIHLQWYEATAQDCHRVPGMVLKTLGRVLDTFRTFVWACRHDLVIVPGAGVFETTTPTRPWGLAYGFLVLGIAGRLCGTCIAYVCVGANPNLGATRWVVTRAARLAHYRSYRDEFSHRSMSEMGVDVSGDKVYADLAFAIGLPSNAESGFRDEQGHPHVVGVGLMNFRGGSSDRPRAHQLHASYLEVMTCFVEMLVLRGWSVRLFTGDKEDEPVVRRVLQSVLDRLGDANGLVFAEPVGSLSELMEVMMDTEIVVASRYHNVLAALRLGIPTLSVSYAPKSDVLMECMGLDRFSHSAHEIDLARLTNQFLDLCQSREEVRNRLIVGNLACATLARQQLDDFADSVLTRLPQIVGTGAPGRGR